MKGFFEVFGILLELPISQSQTTRAPSCATPGYLFDFLNFCVEVGQTVVKRKFHAFLRFYKVPKMPMLQGFFTLLIFRSGVPCSRSQN